MHMEKKMTPKSQDCDGGFVKEDSDGGGRSALSAIELHYKAVVMKVEHWIRMESPKRGKRTTGNLVCF